MSENDLFSDIHTKIDKKRLEIPTSRITFAKQNKKQKITNPQQNYRHLKPAYERRP